MTIFGDKYCIEPRKVIENYRRLEREVPIKGKLDVESPSHHNTQTNINLFSA